MTKKENWWAKYGGKTIDEDYKFHHVLIIRPDNTGHRKTLFIVIHVWIFILTVYKHMNLITDLLSNISCYVLSVTMCSGSFPYSHIMVNMMKMCKSNIFFFLAIGYSLWIGFHFSFSLHMVFSIFITEIVCFLVQK